MSAAVKQAVAAVRAANVALGDTLKAEYPVGGPIQWTINHRVFQGAVVDHGYGGRIKVANVATGKSRWIGAYDIHNPF